MTEFAYICYERLKAGDLLAQYLAECFKTTQDYGHLSCLVYCLTKFDQLFLPKLLLQTLKPSETLQYAQVLLNYF